MLHDSVTLKRKIILEDNITIRIPFSKSISNRLLIISNLAGSVPQIENLSTADDTEMLLKFINQAENKSSNKFYCKNAGTTLRFLLALLSLKEGQWQLDADKRMQTRPLMPLIDILRELGADIKTADTENIFPITINGKILNGNKVIEPKKSLTSQIISALLLISGKVKGGFSIVLPKNQTSMPYIDMTVSLVNRFGGQIKRNDNILVCSESQYYFNKIKVESDFSAAAFFFLYTAVGKLKSIKLNNLQTSSLQGDSICIKLFERFGVRTEFQKDGAVLSYDADLMPCNQNLEFDLSDYPDLFCPIAVAGYISGKEICIKNLASLRVKESNRLKNMITELNKLGNRCKEENNCMIIAPLSDTHARRIWKERGFAFNTYNDHRIAMALSAVAFTCKNITIKNPDCVKKSFPDFWSQAHNFLDCFFSKELSNSQEEKE